MSCQVLVFAVGDLCTSVPEMNTDDNTLQAQAVDGKKREKGKKRSRIR